MAHEFERCDVVFCRCHEIHGEEPFGEPRLRSMEDLASFGRGLQEAAATLEHALWLAIAVASPATARTSETVRPTHLYNRLVTLLFSAVEPLEAGKAYAFLELDLITCHRRTPQTANKINHKQNLMVT